MSNSKHKSLGRGLSALFGEAEDESGANNIIKDKVQQFAPIEHLTPGKYQPRRIMDVSLIDELANSIKLKGIIQPILVRPHKDNEKFEIIAGERRWRAAQKAKLHEVPIIVKDIGDNEVLEIALIENLQRKDLSVLEEAEGYQRLMDEFGYTQEVLSKGISRSRSHVANMLRLLNLPKDVKIFIDNGELSAGHARALLTAKNPSLLSKHVVSKNLNVRETELLVKNSGLESKQTVGEKRDPNIEALEVQLANYLGVGVSIVSKENAGSLTLKYNNLDQLDDLLLRIGLKVI